MAQADVYERICSLLEDSGKQFKRVEHEPTFTSEESAQARGESLAVGGKAILMKVDKSEHLFVLSASKKINAKKVREHLKAKRSRFSTPDELMQLCGLVPGSVPPFGQPILPVKLYFDRTFMDASDKIAFNAGRLTHSIVLDLNDWIEVAKPEIFEFAE